MTTMNKTIKNEQEQRLALNIGRTKRYLEEGLSQSEIAEKLGVGVSTVRTWIGIINQANVNMAK